MFNIFHAPTTENAIFTFSRGWALIALTDPTPTPLRSETPVAIDGIWIVAGNEYWL